MVRAAIAEEWRIFWTLTVAPLIWQSAKKRNNAEYCFHSRGVVVCPINSRHQTQLVAAAVGVDGCEVDQMRSRNRECVC